jgi:Na+-transporting NADH:ubiquinone oxidoreductase subunit C
MKKESFVKKRIFPVVFMLLVTVVFIAVTTVVYTFTEARIRLNARLQLKRAVLYAAHVPLPRDPAEIEATYDDRVTEVTGETGKIRYYEIRGAASSAVESYVVIHTGTGLWGKITAAIGFDSTLTTFTGFEVIDHNETPGLGGRIDEKWFKEQFRGKRSPLSLVAEGAPASDAQIQAITGASYSSEAILAMANAAKEYALAETQGN